MDILVSGQLYKILFEGRLLFNTRVSPSSGQFQLPTLILLPGGTGVCFRELDCDDQFSHGNKVEAKILTSISRPAEILKVDLQFYARITRRLRANINMLIVN